VRRLLIFVPIALIFTACLVKLFSNHHNYSVFINHVHKHVHVINKSSLIHELRSQRHDFDNRKFKISQSSLQLQLHILYPIVELVRHAPTYLDVFEEVWSKNTHYLYLFIISYQPIPLQDSISLPIGTDGTARPSRQG
jgi:hypothetical protein